ncbi:hypothetical protein BO221_27970 [Archangium sp. Cb G35]|uniref:hypothetical protein n=1 Tax=Archangium sp. Cb G35 TaxID=1920190 RepID=UPI000936BA9B|nr:hypothetical protein [Archangium sp. Cb G35]OJT21643.1 hypothetical protein BO221_27970 [Archangium sp. Cb G35]
MFRGWPRPMQPASLTLDVGSARLGTIALGAPARLLAENLGPPVSYWLMRQRGWWLYPERGLSFEVKNDRIISMAIVVAQPETSLLQRFVDRFQPFSGLVRLGHGTERASNLQERTFREALGTPMETERDREALALTFRVGGVHVDTEFLPNGRLKHLVLFPE